MKKILTLALALILALSLCACGGSSDANQAMYGTYTLYAMNYDENTVVLTEGLFDGESYITLKSGGSAEICLEGDKSNVRWKADGSKLTITAADGDMAGDLTDGILALTVEGSKLYFLAENASGEKLKAVSLDDMLSGVVGDIFNDLTDEPEAPAQPEIPDTPDTPAQPAATEAPKTPSEVQTMWNGWYFGCIDMDGCTDNWAFLNGATYDAVMYVELDREGKGQFAIYDPFGNLVANEHSNMYVWGNCHADTRYLYGDEGTAFNDEIYANDWIFVRNSNIPEKLHVGSESSEANGATIGYTFQFKPWGDRWEGDPYTQFIPYFDAYINALDAGLSSPFGDSFSGFGIAEPIEEDNGGSAANPPATASSGGAKSPLLGSSPARLDVNGKGAVYIYYPADQFRYDDDYGKLRNDDTGVGILIDPMLGSTNLSELKASYEEHNSDEDDYSLVETTIDGYKALIMKYSDWLGSTMRVDLDFGGAHDGFYGMSFAVSGDSLEDCDTDLVWAIIHSMEVVK